MEGNKDEALRCIAIAQKHRDAGNYGSARKFVQKSIGLFETPEAQKLLASINAAEAAGTAKGATASGTETSSSSSGARQRTAASSSSSNGTSSGIGGEKRDYTTEQVTVVKRVRACKVTEYYEILELSKTCSDGEVKKAYRKLALALHPDKNGAPGADEAFKMVSKAFQVLSDPQKRTIFDQSGGDPEDRSGGMPARSSAGFAGHPFSGGQGFEGEISPEDLFNMFFGGGAGFAGNGFGGGFGGGPVFTTNLGPGVFRTTQFGGNLPRRNQTAQAADSRSMLMQLMPIIILFAFSLLSNLSSFLTPTPVPDPHFAFTQTARYNVERVTPGLNVKYFVNPSDLNSHSVIGPELAKQKGLNQEKAGRAVAKFERKVELHWTEEMYTECKRGLDHRERRRDAEVGLFGIGTDWEKVRAIEKEVIPSCVEYERVRRR
ncbi:DnaJ-domain-containing protein [Cylindrobasidium torrendii FP15055 ss-10]|uniref:DnaJ-domain-containing protein n=1 Tax=Cylindrobasidium torrendii FP15055 ss-10 TaxID=1314674 RepID=A0A0D7AWA3_9AGAR|nr:DnaJ-domain-containing protein [Cylindrobasidium torrendii FP15055 ss-10]